MVEETEVIVEEKPVERKIYLSYGTEEREGLERVHPENLLPLESESVDEIQGNDVLERTPDLVNFIEQCYRVLKKGKSAIFSSQHYLSSGAWRNPKTIRGLSEQSLNFSSKTWREQSKFTDFEVSANFEVQGSVALEQEVLIRSEEARHFWMRRYANVAQAMLFTLIKKEPDEV